MPVKWRSLALSLIWFAAPNIPAWGEQQCDPNLPPTTPSERFTVFGQETAGHIYDSKTKLVWKRCGQGLTYTNGSCTGKDEFTWHRISGVLSQDTTSWRLPNIDELYSIVETQCTNPAINLKIFPDNRSLVYWSGTTFEEDEDYAYNVFFGRGLINNDLKINIFRVRLVTGPEWFDPNGYLGKSRQ